MRPRVFPAEDTGELEGSPGGEVRASMRPRVFPAEDRSGRGDIAKDVALQ